MSIPPKVQALLDRLHSELDETEQETTATLKIVRQRLSLFPGNEIFIQFFASLNNILFFVEINRGRIQRIVDRISPENVPSELIQEAGEDLGMILGRVLEVKINAKRLKTRLEI